MTRVVRSLLPAVLTISTFSALPYKHIRDYTIPEQPRIVFLYTDADRSRILIDSATIAGIPAHYLAAIYFAESTCGKNMRHPDPWDVGPMGLHERPSYHLERMAKWGPYDPYWLPDASRIAAMELAEDYAYFCDWDLTFSAYRKGRSWVAKHGVYKPYVSKVRGYLAMGVKYE